MHDPEDDEPDCIDEDAEDFICPECDGDGLSWDGILDCPYCEGDGTVNL